MFRDSMWIGVPRTELEKWNILEGDLTGRFAYYKCELDLMVAGKLIIDISSNSKYRLWVNEEPVLSGSCKGDRYRCFYDTVDVSEHLVRGKNVLAVQVLYQNQDAAVTQHDERAAIFAVMSQGGGHRLAVEGTVFDADGNGIATVTTGKADWRVWLDGSFYLKSYEVTENLGAVCEEIDFRTSLTNWKSGRCEIREWVKAVSLETVVASDFYQTVGFVKRFPMKERPIPLLYEKKEYFLRELHEKSVGDSGLLTERGWKVPAGQTAEVVLDAGIIKNGYPRFFIEGGDGARVTITYFEKFVNQNKNISRDDFTQGIVEGRKDILLLSGDRFCYEPFWYRTFRFVRICVESRDRDVHLLTPEFRRTGYPLNSESYVESSQSWVSDVWNMCVHTLENCMMDTYMDCPYYEQMQFPMDTRLQALFNYTVSTDWRLAKKALDDYHCSMIPDGLIHGKYPSCYPQIISTFSLHYIFMLYEYYQHTGEMETVRRYFPDMDRILYYYDSKITRAGLLGRLGYWEFVDWNPAWDKTGGVPAAVEAGSSTIINLMYAYALLCAAKLNTAAKRRGMAEEYMQRRQCILEKVQMLCWDEERKMLREGPAFKQYSQHAQAWAVLNGMWDRELSRKVLREAMQCSDVLKVSFSTSYEWFRALELARIYEDTQENMQQWIDLLKLGCTTCPEIPGIARSENHAWSALPMYEMVRALGGITPMDAGWGKVRIEPHLSYLPDLKGCAVTPKGKIRFSYQKKDGKWEYMIELPPGLEGILVDESGKENLL